MPKKIQNSLTEQ
jgi:tetratricopeptide (TPR) repeat protein